MFIDGNWSSVYGACEATLVYKSLGIRPKNSLLSVTDTVPKTRYSVCDTVYRPLLLTICSTDQQNVPKKGPCLLFLGSYIYPFSFFYVPKRGYYYIRLLKGTLTTIPDTNAPIVNRHHTFDRTPFFSFLTRYFISDTQHSIVNGHARCKRPLTVHRTVALLHLRYTMNKEGGVQVSEINQGT